MSNLQFVCLDDGEPVKKMRQYRRQSSSMRVAAKHDRQGYNRFNRPQLPAHVRRSHGASEHCLPSAAFNKNSAASCTSRTAASVRKSVAARKSVFARKSTFARKASFVGKSVAAGRSASTGNSVASWKFKVYQSRYSASGHLIIILVFVLIVAGFIFSLSRRTGKDSEQALSEQQTTDLKKARFISDVSEFLATHPLAANFDPPLVECGQTGMKMQPPVVKALDELAVAVRQATGDQLQLESAYRSFAEQLQVKKLNPNVAATPGASEHETGLAVDISTPLGGLYTFAHTPAGRFVAAHAWRYGFIIRYPEDKVKITGIPYEPWHLRYVGKIHAAVIHRQKWCLEEYIQSLSEHDFFAAHDYRIYRGSVLSREMPTTWEDLVISEDNTGSYIFTYRVKEE